MNSMKNIFCWCIYYSFSSNSCNLF